MPRSFILPYTTPPEGTVSPPEWRITPAHPSVEVLPERLEHWDHTVDLGVDATVTADPAAVASVCGLGPWSSFAAVLSWHATGSGLRQTAAVAELRDDGPTTVHAQLDGGRLGGVLRLAVSIVVRRPEEPAPAAPSQPGAVLVRDTRSWSLEGTGDRFPVERIDFREAGIRGPDAAWTVRWVRKDPEWDAHAAVRLQLNSRHPATGVLLEGDSDTGALTRTVLRRDVLRELVAAALMMDDFDIDPSGWPEGSLGQSLSLTLATVFPGLILDEIRALHRDTPDDFEAALQDATAFLRPGDIR